MDNPTIAKIVEDWLEKNGYDGLFYAGKCGCFNSILMPCGTPNHGCEAGYEVPNPHEHPEDHGEED